MTLIQRDWLNDIPSGYGIEDKLISNVESKEPMSKPVSFQNFNDMASKKDYNNLKEVYNSILEKYPDFEVPEGLLNNLGLQLVFNPNTSKEGIKVFEFATYLYPSSSNLYDSMGEAYLFIGDHDKALSSFKRSLELNASNYNARKRITELTK